MSGGATHFLASSVVMHHTRRIITAYEAVYPDPIVVQGGDVVAVEREDDEYRGWWWCVAADARAGWVPAALLTPAPTPGARVSAIAEYSARELTVALGAVVTWLETRDGWVRVRRADGAIGWIPASCLDGGPPPA